jgi:hypothetical protein
MEKEKHNKSITPSEDKAEEEPRETMVRIRINHNRAIAGIGTAGDEIEVSQLVAMNFVAQGLATIIEKEK